MVTQGLYHSTTVTPVRDRSKYILVWIQEVLKGGILNFDFGFQRVNPTHKMRYF